MKNFFTFIVVSALVSNATAFASWNTLCVSKASDANYTVCGVARDEKAPFAKCDKWGGDTLAAGSPITRVFWDTDLLNLFSKASRLKCNKTVTDLSKDQNWIYINEHGY
ncbi:MAG: hypothetical protein HQK53_15240 [Oligoflexia bacterium]|nr:hypothetical protein [Oligoflexia bacterium]